MGMGMMEFRCVIATASFVAAITLLLLSGDMACHYDTPHGPRIADAILIAGCP